MANRRDRNRAGTTGSRSSKAARPPATRAAGAAPGVQPAAATVDAGGSTKLAANRAARELARTSRDAERKRTQRRRTLIRSGVIAAIAASLIAVIVLVAFPGGDIGIGSATRARGTSRTGRRSPSGIARRHPARTTSAAPRTA